MDIRCGQSFPPHQSRIFLLPPARKYATIMDVSEDFPIIPNTKETGCRNDQFQRTEPRRIHRAPGEDPPPVLALIGGHRRRRAVQRPAAPEFHPHRAALRREPGLSGCRAVPGAVLPATADRGADREPDRPERGAAVRHQRGKPGPAHRVADLGPAVEGRCHPRRHGRHHPSPGHADGRLLCPDADAGPGPRLPGDRRPLPPGGTGDRRTVHGIPGAG